MTDIKVTSQVKQFPVVFERGVGSSITDMDGNTLIDFSSSIYFTSTGRTGRGRHEVFP